MRFLVDAQLPPVLASWLRSKGHEARHVVDADLGDAPDARHLGAGDRGRLHDRDQGPRFRDWALARTPKARILWVRFGNIRRDALIARFETVWPELSGVLASDVTIIEVGR